MINDFYLNNDIVNYLIDNDEDYQEISNDYQVDMEKLMSITTLVLELYRQIYNELTLEEIQDVKYKIMDKIQERLKYEINKLQSPIYLPETLESLEKQIKYLDSIPQPAQRTPEWYEFRNNRLTASDLGTAMNINPYSQMDKLIMKKCGEEQPFVVNSAITHGVKFEDVAIAVYQKNKTQIKISESLLRANRVDFIAPADFSEKSKLYDNMKYLLDHVIAKIKYRLKLKS